jgi:dTDP-4-amino-4,6-dideoxygalactose transaminase
MQEGLYDFYTLLNWYCNLALDGFNKLNQQLEHRRQIAQIYAENLNKKILHSRILEKIEFSTNLRFPIFIENREDLIKFLKGSGIFVSDIWYDDIAPECSYAVEISKTILNLPTHKNVTGNDARKIAEMVNLWLKSQ